MLQMGWMSFCKFMTRGSNSKEVTFTSQAQVKQIMQVWPL